MNSLVLPSVQHFIVIGVERIIGMVSQRCSGCIVVRIGMKG